MDVEALLLPFGGLLGRITATRGNCSHEVLWITWESLDGRPPWQLGRFTSLLLAMIWAVERPMQSILAI